MNKGRGFINLITLIFSIIILLILLVYIVIKKDFINPIILFLIPLVTGYILYYFYYFEYIGIPPLKDTTYVSFNLMLIGFILGYLYLPLKVNKKNEFKYTLKNTFFLNVLLCIGIIGFVINLLQVIKWGLSGPSNFFFNIRYANTIDRKTLYGSHFMLIIHVYVIIQLLVDEKKNSKIYFYIFIWFVSTFFAMARTDLLLFISTICIAISLRSSNAIKIRINKKVFLLIGLFLFLFFISGSLTKKIEDNYLDSFINYLSYPLISFDTYIEPLAATYKGQNIFILIYKILGLPTVDLLNLKRGTFNVFTAMSAPYLDFGILGIFPIFFIIGLGYRYVYTKVKQNNIFFKILFCFIAFPLLMSFYDFTFNYTVFIYYLIIIFIFKHFLKKV